MAGFTEIFIDAGASFNTEIAIRDSQTGVGLNLATYTVTSQIRKSYYSRNPTANFTCTITDSSNGNVEISLSGVQTGNITPGKYVYDVRANSGSSVFRVVEGIVIITPSVTR